MMLSLPTRTEQISEKIDRKITGNPGLTNIPPVAVVIDALAYDPETGVMTWRNRRGGKIVAGMTAGCVRSDGYRTIAILNKPFRAHRLAWLIHYGYWPIEVDHINGERDDNRIANLRECTRSENLANKRPAKNASSKYKGVYFSAAAKKWVARITVNYKGIHLGCFETQESAHAAYTKAANKYRGKFARVK